MSAEENIAVVVLAAGGSSRLGRPKQLVEFNGKPLLDHALDKVDLLGFQTKILVLDDVLFLVSDQPFLERANLIKLVHTQLTQHPKATYSKYGDNIGVPAIFSKEAFPLLLELEGDEGAKKLTRLEGFDFCTETFKKGGFDVDTEEDVKQLKQMEE